jgi:hypothetical protein
VTDGSKRGSSIGTVVAVIGVLMAVITLLWQLGYISPRRAPPTILNLSPSGGVAGASINASGSGFDRNELVVIYVQAMEVARTITDDRGEFFVSAVIPASLDAFSPFQAGVAAIGQTSARPAGAAFNVADPCGYQTLADKARAIQERRYCKG